MSDGVQQLDLGPRDEPQDVVPPRRPTDRRTVVLRVAALGGALAVLLAAAPDAARPGPDDLAVAVSGAAPGAPGAPTEDALDAVRLEVEVRNDGPRDVVLDRVTVPGTVAAAPGGSPTAVAAGATAVVALDVVPDCSAREVGTVVDLAVRGAGGARRLTVPAAVQDSPVERLCPATERGVHASVTGLRRDPQTGAVRVRVVNHGTESVVLATRPLVPALEADGSTVYLDPDIEVEPGTDRVGPVVRLLPLVRSTPPLPTDLAPGQGIVLVLRSAQNACRTEVPADLHLEVQGENGNQRVAGSDDVVAAVLAGPESGCR